MEAEAEAVNGKLKEAEAKEKLTAVPSLVKIKKKMLIVMALLKAMFRTKLMIKLALLEAMNKMKGSCCVILSDLS